MKSSYNYNKKEKVIGKSKSLTFLFFLWSSFAATVVNAQGSIEEGYGREMGTTRLKELFVTFHSLSGELSSGLTDQLTGVDLAQIEQAIYYVPYYQDSIELAETACDYYNSADFTDSEVDYLIDLLAAATRMEYEGQEAHFEAAYQALSTPAKARFNGLLRSKSSEISRMKQISFDIEKMAQENDIDTTLQHISQVCERLPLAIEMFPSGKKLEFTEITIDLQD